MNVKKKTTLGLNKKIIPEKLVCTQSLSLAAGRGLTTRDSSTVNELTAEDDEAKNGFTAVNDSAREELTTGGG